MVDAYPVGSSCVSECGASTRQSSCDLLTRRRISAPASRIRGRPGRNSQDRSRVGCCVSEVGEEDCVPYDWGMNAVEWERMGRELRERAARWEHPAAEPETSEDVAALDQLAEAFRAGMNRPPAAEAPSRGAQ